MPKTPPKTNPKCPKCNNTTAKNGSRKNKQRIVQRFLCRRCQYFFTTQPLLQQHKTHNINLILNTITNLNLGYSLKQTKNYFKKHKIKKSTLSCWYNQLKPQLPYHRLRKTIKQNYKPTEIIKTKKFIHHKQPFIYQYHKPKLDLYLKQYPKLKHYLENIQNLLPNFNNTLRISHIAKNKVIKFPLTQKQNYATTLANIALQITKTNKQRHHIIENLMLKNDTTTIATEIPVYLTKNITGHIDILQIRYNKLHILDFKPEKIKTTQATTQLYLYAKALSNITKIPLKKIKCAFFNNENYYEFSP